MKHLQLIIFSCLFFFNFCYAQKSQSTTDTILINKGRYYINDHLYKNRFKLEPLFLKYPSSSLELKKYNQIATPGILFLLVSITSGVIGFTQSSKDLPLLNKYSITQYSTGFVGVIIMTFANKHFKRAIKQYNKEKLQSL